MSFTYCLQKQTTFPLASSLPIKFDSSIIAALWEDIQFGVLPRDCIVMMFHYHSKAKNKRLHLTETAANFKGNL